MKDGIISLKETINCGAQKSQKIVTNTASKVSKYVVFSGPYFPAFGLNTEKYGVDKEYLSVFSLNAGKYGPEKTLYFDTFHVVYDHSINKKKCLQRAISTDLNKRILISTET